LNQPAGARLPLPGRFADSLRKAFYQNNGGFEPILFARKHLLTFSDNVTKVLARHNNAATLPRANPTPTARSTPPTW